MISKKEFLKNTPERFIDGENRFFTYNHYLRSVFGERVQRITIDAGFTCPNRDGTVAVGGCTYCNNDSFSPASHLYRPKVYIKPTKPVKTQIQEQMTFLAKRYGADRFIAYFQAYSNTYAPVEELADVYRQALEIPSIMGLCVGTRPDCIDDRKLDLFCDIAKHHSVSIEYGCESIYDRTLQWVNRGHDFACFVEAVEKTAARGLDVGTHLILGFPTETRHEMLHAAEVLSDLPIDFIKLHNLHVVSKTALAVMFADSPFPILGKSEYVELVADFLERLRSDICVQRLHAETPPSMLIAPDWTATGSEMQTLVNEELTRRNTYQGFNVREGVTETC